jgi:two-component system, OmpR family, response regulator MtrA
MMGGMPGHILLVEDDDAIRAQTALLLRDEGYEVTEAADGDAALAGFERRSADCVLLDGMLPDVDGFEVCRRLRARSDVPIIMVSARDDSFDIVAGLEAGADDYVTKPFVPKELTARIRAMLRRVQGFGGEGDPGTLRLGDRIDVVPADGVVRVEGEEVHLTRTEFRLLCELASRPGRVLSRELLLELVWGYEYVADTKLVDVHVYRLRSKIEADPAKPVHLVTVRGLGYKAVA